MWNVECGVWNGCAERNVECGVWNGCAMLNVGWSAEQMKNEEIQH